MWKLVLGFLVFAGLAMFVLMRGGEIDMSGEKHGSETSHPEPAAAPAAVPAPAPAAAPAEAAASAAK